MELVSEYSFWWMLPIVLLSLALSALLYYRNSREDFPIVWNIILGLVRWLAFSFLGFLLLSPMLKSWTEEIQKPIIIVLQDESQSIALNADSNYYRNDFPPQMQEMVSDIEVDYEVKTFSFAQSIQSQIPYQFKGKSTDMSGALQAIYEEYSHMNIGALIVATDGIYNQGQNPYYLAKKMQFPIYFIGLGDTVIQRDLRINRKAYNKTIFLGNKFPIEVEVASLKAQGYQSELQLIYKGKIIDRKKIKINSSNQKNIFRFYPEAKASGLQEYRIRLKPIDDEVNKQNNNARIFVNVIDSKQKILILFDSPHPDIAAVKSALEKHETYEVESFQINKFNKRINGYNLVILHQLPNGSHLATQYGQSIKQARIPFLLIASGKTSLSQLNQLHLGMEIQSKRMSVNTVSPLLNPNFSTFTLSREFQSSIASFPPLSAPYGNYNYTKALQTLLYQQIGSVKTKMPLIGFANISGWRSGYIMGEGIWRWRFHDYLKNSNHQIFDELIGKMVRYLSLVKEQSEFDLEVKKQFDESEPVIFDAVLYNASYEPITDHSIEMVILDENGKEYPYSFSKRDSSYYLNAGSFAPGIYQYKAQVNKGGIKTIRAGRFTVSEISQEGIQLTADHHLLYMIAEEHQAKVFDMNSIPEIADEIKSREDLVSIQYNRLKYRDLIDVEWWLLILLLGFSLEWFIRKQLGSY